MTEEEMSKVLFKPMVDMSLYTKMMAIDPSAARTFIQMRMDNLNAQIEPIREEIKKLNEIMSYDKNKEIVTHYNRTNKVKKPYGMKATLTAFFIENIGKEIRVTTAVEHLRTKGFDIMNSGDVSSRLTQMKNDGTLTSPYRGVYKMEKESERVS